MLFWVVEEAFKKALPQKKREEDTTHWCSKPANSLWTVALLCELFLLGDYIDTYWQCFSIIFLFVSGLILSRIAEKNYVHYLWLGNYIQITDYFCKAGKGAKEDLKINFKNCNLDRKPDATIWRNINE
jgi:hypothetical protein